MRQLGIATDSERQALAAALACSSGAALPASDVARLYRSIEHAVGPVAAKVACEEAGLETLRGRVTGGDIVLALAAAAAAAKEEQ